MSDKMQLREGETIGEYVMRLEKRLQELEPPEGFTIQEWHVGQVYAYILRPQEGDEDALRDLRAAFEWRFPEQTKKFAAYMGWGAKR